MSNVSLNPVACITCSKLIIRTSSRQKYCTECSKKREKELVHGYYKSRYKPKGYNQTRDANNYWKGGKGVYKQIAFEHYGKVCSCGSTLNLCVHHKDEDRSNNEISNLEVMCRSCHAKRHNLYKNFTP